ncbi:ATP-binding protein [Vibrio anguillarum]|uniref:ATP-binding protein n=1 Tax=Vibrio anguillarum TaxID=55601 RepID=UPI0002FBAC7C|nr:transporter substrate-binding domain-containing protein [Vibrio anguillarum]OEE50902.1 VieS [Vibrio anguillarum]
MNLLRIYLLLILAINLLFNTVYAADYLSDSERTYLKAKKVIVMGVLSEPWLPYWGGIENTIGIQHDYAVGIGKELDVKIEYRSYQSITDLVTAVHDGDVDFAIGFSKTKEREKNILFSLPLYNNLRVIWLRDKKLNQQDMNHLKWVCVQGSSYCETLEQSHYPHILLAQSFLESAEMMKQGLADATITNYISLNHYISPNSGYDGEIIADGRLGVEINRIILPMGNNELKSIFDKLILAEATGNTANKIDSTNIYFLNNKDSLKLLSQENSNQIVRYTIEEDIYPLSYCDEGDNQVKGYVHDLLKLIESKSFLKFQYVPANGRDIRQMLIDNEVDLLPSLNVDDIDNRDFIATPPYTNLQFGYVVTKKPFQQKKLAILDRTGYLYSHLKIYEDNKKVKVYRDLKKVILDLKSGKITHALMNQDIINQQMAYLGDKFLILPAIDNEGYSINIGMVFRKDESILFEMLSRSLTMVTESEINALKSLHKKVNVNYGYDKQQVTIYSLIAMCIFLFLLLFGIIIFYKLKSSLKYSQISSKLSEVQVQWLTDLLDKIPSMIFISDVNGKVVLSNRSYKQCSKASLISDDVNCLICTGIGSVDLSNKHYQIDEKYYVINHESIAHPKSGDTHYLTVCSDITELKLSELALRDSNNKALEAVDARNHFLAVMSHELRTPIAAMLGLMEILSTRIKNDESRLLLTNAIRSAERIKHHVHEILDFSKMEAQQLQLDIRQHNILEELCPTIRSFEASAKLKGVEFVVDWVPTAIIYAKFDALRLNQVLTNVLANAVKFTTAGTVSIHVELTEEQIVFAVKDTGCGMNEAHLDSLFKPFMQADKTITRQYGGTGLGMSIVSNLVNLMDGHITVSSTLNEGTQVTIVLPICGEPLSEPLSQRNYRCTNERIIEWLKCWQVSVSQGGVSLVDFDAIMTKKHLYPDLLIDKIKDSEQVLVQPKKMKLCGHVLVVDDDAINRLLLKKQLHELGVQATIVGDGEEAFHLLQSEDSQFDLLLTDCHMPKMDGFALARFVKNHIPQERYKVVIGCTAEDSRLIAEKAYQSGMEHVLYKPYSLASLYTMLSGYLSMYPLVNADSKSWLESFLPGEKSEIASVVAESLAAEVDRLEKHDSDYKMIAHRVKGSAGALQLDYLASLAVSLERELEPQAVVSAKQRLIMEMKIVIIQAQEWLDKQQRVDDE